MDYYKETAGHKLCNKSTSQPNLSSVLSMSLIYDIPLMATIMPIIGSRVAAAKPFLKTDVPVDDIAKTLLDLFWEVFVTAYPYFRYTEDDTKSDKTGEGFYVRCLLTKLV